MNNNIKRGGLVAATLLGCLGLAVSAQGASFDCGKASTTVERLICDNPAISELDEKLAATYKAALKDKQQASSIKQAQRDWLVARNDCGEGGSSPLWCLLDAYKNRLKDLGVSRSGIESNRTEKTGERHRYFIDDESELIDDENENRPFCREVLAALIKTRPSATHRACIAEEVLKLPGVGDPAWEKLDLSQHEELAKKIMTLSTVGSIEYFRKQKLMPERYPTPEQQQLRLDNIKKKRAELFMMHLPPELFGDRVLVTLRHRSMGCGTPFELVGEVGQGEWVTPDLKEIATGPGIFDSYAGRPLTYRGRLYLMQPAGSGELVELYIPRREHISRICRISITID